MPMAKSLATLAAAVVGFLLVGTATLAVEPFRTFHTTQGHSMVGRLIGYQGQTIFIEDQAGKRYQLEFRLLSEADGKYCIDAAKQQRIPSGVPPVQTQSPGPAQGQPPTTPAPGDPTPSSTLTPPPQTQPLRSGSFFSHKAAPLGEDPKAFAVEAGGMPAPGEPIDFQSHVVPII
ncbi:uncharacterized protein METZ01_LOCUS387693, partial [marine metagenome]